MSQVKKLYFD